MSEEQPDPGNPVPAREVARLLGLSVATVHGYDRGGLIDQRHVTRDADGRRSYDLAVVPRLSALIDVGGTGLPIEEMQTLAAALDDGTLTDERRLEFLERNLALLDGEIDRLGSVRRTVVAKIAQLQARDG